MSRDDESIGDRIERRIAEEDPSDTSFIAPFLKVAVLGLSTFLGWQAALATLYVLIGDSLGVRMAESRYLGEYALVVLLWLPMLVLDAAGLTKGDA